MSELENKGNEKQGLSGKELYELKKGDKGKDRQKEGRKEKLGNVNRKIGKYALYTIVSVSVVGGIFLFVSVRPNLPPTTSQGHIESIPPTHIVTTPIQDTIQRHMLEHADGSDSNGSSIIIQYNCDDYDCEQDLVSKLTSLVEEYPRNVYLAPNNYDGKIILTGIGRREILDDFDEQAIRDFIDR